MEIVGSFGPRNFAEMLVGSMNLCGRRTHYDRKGIGQEGPSLVAHKPQKKQPRVRGKLLSYIACS